MVHEYISALIQIDLSTEDSVLSHFRPQLLDFKVLRATFVLFSWGWGDSEAKHSIAASAYSV